MIARRDARVTQNFLDWALSEADAGRMADVPAAETILAPGQPVLTLLESCGPQRVFDRLVEAAARLESWLYGQ